MPDLADTPLSLLDLATVVRDGTPAQAYERTVEVARLVEQAGFRRFWLAEHHNLEGIASAATAVLIGHVAGRTERIRVGSGGVMLPNHAPLIVAEQFGTLESLYPGRIDLGLGRAPGTDPLTVRAVRGAAAAMEPDFAALLEELRRYLRPPAAGQAVRAIPGEGLAIPIWLLGSSGYSAQLAGQLGLPFAFASHFAPRHVLDALELYRSVFRPSEVLERPHAMVAMNVIVGATDAHAEYLASSLRQRFLRMVRNRRGPLDPPVEDMDALWSRQERSMVEAMLSASAVGSPDTVRDRMQAFLDATRADEIIVATDIHSQRERLASLRLLAEAAGRA
ncbi:MAG TPA: LLM class flavin-dependent oxidoreductase [Gammaproteobacteria bacterium]|nr:LLM class flavin-dependent oxidoreductase [Gammaproteobacteria bacterium]